MCDVLYWCCLHPQEDLVKLKDIEGSLVIFCVATYGEGDPTDNALDLYEWLKDGGHDLSGVRYTVSATTGSK